MSLPDTDLYATEAAQIRARFAMLAARDVANTISKHALELADLGAREHAQEIDAEIAAWRDRERKFAASAGIGND